MAPESVLGEASVSDAGEQAVDLQKCSKGGRSSEVDNGKVVFDSTTAATSQRMGANSDSNEAKQMIAAECGVGLIPKSVVEEASVSDAAGTGKRFRRTRLLALL